jgi:hypothetical protein
MRVWKIPVRDAEAAGIVAAGRGGMFLAAHCSRRRHCSGSRRVRRTEGGGGGVVLCPEHPPARLLRLRRLVPCPSGPEAALISIAVKDYCTSIRWWADSVSVSQVRFRSNDTPSSNTATLPTGLQTDHTRLATRQHQQTWTQRTGFIHFLRKVGNNVWHNGDAVVASRIQDWGRNKWWWAIVRETRQRNRVIIAVGRHSGSAWTDDQKFEVCVHSMPFTSWALRAWRTCRRGRLMTRRGLTVPSRFATLQQPGEWEWGCILANRWIEQGLFTETQVCTFPFRRNVKLCYLCSPLMWGGDYNPSTSKESIIYHSA